MDRDENRHTFLKLHRPCCCNRKYIHCIRIKVAELKKYLSLYLEMKKDIKMNNFVIIVFFETKWKLKITQLNINYYIMTNEC